MGESYPINSNTPAFHKAEMLQQNNYAITYVTRTLSIHT